MRSNTETQELKMECTGCSNFCGLLVQIENETIVNLEGNCCHRAIISVKRQLGITDDKKNSPKVKL